MGALAFFPCRLQYSLSYVYRERESSNPQPCSGPFWDFCLVGPHPIRVHCELQGSCWANPCLWTEELRGSGPSSIGLYLLCMAETSRSIPTSLQTSTILDRGWGLIVFKHTAHWTCCLTQCIWQYTYPILGFPGGASGKEPTVQWRRCKRHRFDPWIGKMPWRRKWQSTPVFLPEEFRGWRSLGYSSWDHKESDMTAWLSTQHRKDFRKSFCTKE